MIPSLPGRHTVQGGNRWGVYNEVTIENIIYKEKLWYSPKDVSPPGFSVEKVRGRDSVDWLGNLFLKIFRPRTLLVKWNC
jgi:hypothetical protein